MRESNEIAVNIFFKIITCDNHSPTMKNINQLLKKPIINVKNNLMLKAGISQ